MRKTPIARLVEAHLLPNESTRQFAAVYSDNVLTNEEFAELYASWCSRRIKEVAKQAQQKFEENKLTPVADIVVPGPSMGWRDVRDRAKQQGYKVKAIQRSEAMSATSLISEREQGYLDRVESYAKEHGVSTFAACKALGINSGNYYGAKVKRDGRSATRPLKEKTSVAPRDSELSKAAPVNSTKPSYKEKIYEGLTPAHATTTAVAVEKTIESRVRVIVVEGTREDVLAVLKEALR